MNALTQRGLQRGTRHDGLARVGVDARKLDQTAAADADIGTIARRPRGTTNTCRTVVRNRALKTNRLASAWGKGHTATAHHKQVGTCSLARLTTVVARSCKCIVVTKQSIAGNGQVATRAAVTAHKYGPPVS